MATTAGAGSSALILTQSKWLRLLTVLLFYFTQGFPIGLFFYAIPAWMAANGAGASDIAWVVGAGGLPWSLKLINGFLIDRYTFLPMGRRRSWIIGAQTVLVGVFVAGAIMSPAANDLMLLAGFAFVANFAVTFQDVGIDSLMIDMMPEEERARASGFMYGAQVIGISAATALGGAMFQNFGFGAGLVAAAAVPAFVLLYGILIREREGERRLPWSAGKAHPNSQLNQIEAWWPLLKRAFRALFSPYSLLLIPILLGRSIPYGSLDTFNPVLFTQTVGWELDEWTSFYATLTFVGGIFALLLGGWIVEKLGVERAILGASIFGVALMLVMGSTQSMWGNGWYSAGFVVLNDAAFLFYSIAMIPLCMRLCSPAVAATQFTIFMAIGNFGRPIGATVASFTAGEGNPHWMYWIGAMTWCVVALTVIFVRFPKANVAKSTPDGEGIAARVN